MASGNRGIVVFIALGAVLAGALVVGYLAVWEPKRQQKRAQSEVREYSALWAKARECFVGRAPMSSDLYESMMVREITRTNIVDELSNCASLIVEAKRPGKFDSESTAIEAAWTEVKKKRSALATALAHRRADRPVRPVRELRRRLAEALEEAEQAHRTLLAAAAVADDDATKDALPSAQTAPLHPDLGMTPELADLRIENNRILAVSVVGDSRFLYRLGDGLSNKTPLRRGVFVAAGGEGWGVENRDAIFIARTLASEPDANEAEVGRFANTRLLGAIGDEAGARRLALIGAKDLTLTVLASSAPGEPFVRTPFAPPWGDKMLPSTDTDLLFERMVMSAAGHTVEWRVGGTEVQRYELEGTPCLGANASWWYDGEALIRNDGTTTTTIGKSEDMPWRRTACTDTQLLGVYYAYPPTAEVRVCDQRSCPVSTKLPVAIDTQLIPVIGSSGPVLAAVSADILVLWTPASGKGLRPSVAVRLESGSKVLGLIDWDGQLGVVVRNGKETAIAKITR